MLCIEAVKELADDLVINENPPLKYLLKHLLTYKRSQDHQLYERQEVGKKARYHDSSKQRTSSC